MQKLQAQANLNDTAPNPETGKLGYKVLQVGLTFAEQVTAENTIYEIRDVFDLGGTQETPVSVTIPTGSVLKFNGGIVNNCTLVNSYIDAERVKIFGDNVLFDNLKNGIVYPEWWGAVADGTTDVSTSVQKALGVPKTVSFARGTYLCNTALECSINASIVGENKAQSIIKTNGITLNRFSTVKDITIYAINKSTPYILKVSNSVFGQSEFTANITISNVRLRGGGFYDTTDNLIKAIIIECCITTNTSGMYNATFENIMIDGKVNYGLYFNSVDNTSNDYSWLTYFYFNNIFINGAKYPIEFVSNSELEQYNFQAMYFANVTAQHNADYTESFIRLTHISNSVFDKCHCVDKPNTFSDYYVKDEYCKVNINAYPFSYNKMLSSYITNASEEQNLSKFTYGVVPANNAVKVKCLEESVNKSDNVNPPVHPIMYPMWYLNNGANTGFVGIRMTTNNQFFSTRRDFILGMDKSGFLVYDFGEMDGSNWLPKRIYTTHSIPVQGSGNDFPSGSKYGRGGFVYYVPLKHLICYNTYTGEWQDALGVRITSNITARRGTTITRTGMTMYAYNDGFMFYDTDLKKYVYWNGTAWVNLDGTVLS